jgi:aldose 1-epimerase
VALGREPSAEPLNVHGTGWQSFGEIQSQEPAKAVLVLHRIVPGEPYSCTAEQGFVLTRDCLIVTTTLINRGTRTMPFGIGQHPWFERDPDVNLA